MSRVVPLFVLLDRELHSYESGQTYAFGGFGSRSTFFTARMSFSGSAQCCSGLSPGTAYDSSSGATSLLLKKEVDLAETLVASRTGATMERSFMA